MKKTNGPIHLSDLLGVADDGSDNIVPLPEAMSTRAGRFARCGARASTAV